MKQVKWLKNIRERYCDAPAGQSLVEFSLVLVILIVLLSGLLDFGRVYYIYVAMEDAVGEAALFLSIFPDCPTDSGGDCSDPNNATYRAVNATNVLNATELANGLTISPPASVDNRVTVTVQLDYDFQILTPFVSQIASEIPLSVNATQTIINQIAE